MKTTEQLNPSHVCFEIIDSNYYNLVKNFKCGNSSLENHLKQNAYYNTIDLEECTNLVYYQGNFVGYFSLKKSKLKLDTDMSELDYNTSLDISRIAVDLSYQEIGIGSEIIKRIINLAKSVNERFITLDALIEVHSWYEKRGFSSFIEQEELISNRDGLVYMIMDLYDKKIVEEYLEEDVV